MIKSKERYYIYSCHSVKEVESRINLGTVSFHKSYFVREMTAFIFDHNTIGH